MKIISGLKIIAMAMIADGFMNILLIIAVVMVVLGIAIAKNI